MELNHATADRHFLFLTTQLHVEKNSLGLCLPVCLSISKLTEEAAEEEKSNPHEFLWEKQLGSCLKVTDCSILSLFSSFSLGQMIRRRGYAICSLLPSARIHMNTNICNMREEQKYTHTCNKLLYYTEEENIFPVAITGKDIGKKFQKLCSVFSTLLLLNWYFPVS